MNGIITDIDDKKVVIETEDGEEHKYLLKRIKYPDPEIDDKVVVANNGNGVEITRQKEKKETPQKKAAPKKPAAFPVKKQKRKKPEPDYDTYDEEEEDEEERYDEDDEEGFGVDEDGDDGGYGYAPEDTGTGLAGFCFSVFSFIGGLIPAVIGFCLSKSAKDKGDNGKLASAGYTIGKIMMIITLIITMIAAAAGGTVIKKTADKMKNLKSLTQTEVTKNDADDKDDGSSYSQPSDTWIETD